jgi:4-amino-4-deoxy-L-arabinose transferase-like glycosyltransferase
VPRGSAPLFHARLVALAVVTGFLARAAFGLFYWNGKPLTHDEREYLALATNIWQGRGFTQVLPREPPSSVQQFARAPFYPLFLAPLTAFDRDLDAGRLPSDVPVSVKIAQAVVGALGVWLIARIAGRAWGGRAAAIAGLVASIYPPLVWICAYALSEALYSTLALACVWMLGTVVERDVQDHRSLPLGPTGSLQPPSTAAPSSQAVKGDLKFIVGAGLVAGLAALTRPAMLLFVPLAGVLLILRAERWRDGLTRAALFAGATAVVIVPWTIRNLEAHGRFVLIAAEGGITFWTGNHPDARGEGDLAANPHLKELNRAFREAHPALSEEDLEPLYYRDALHFIVEDPLRWIGLVGRKLFYAIVPIGPSYGLHSRLYRLSSSISYLLLLPFAVAGAWRLRTSLPVSLVTLALSSVLVSLVFFPQERFRIPVLDPTLIVLGSGFLASALARRLH